MERVTGFAWARTLGSEAAEDFCGRTLQREHGEGIVRSEWIERMFGPKLVEAFARIKTAFDPRGIFNPGKIVDPLPMDSNLRYGEGFVSQQPETVLDFSTHGGMAGLAGAGELMSIHHYLSYPESLSAGYGFTAIIVAWLARLNPAYTIVSGIFFAGIIVGGDAIQISMGMPAATVDVFNGMILVFLIMGDFFISHRVRIRFGRTVDA